MRFYIGRRLLWGFYGGVSGSFHPSRVLHGAGSADEGVSLNSIAFVIGFGFVILWLSLPH